MTMKRAMVYRFIMLVFVAFGWAEGASAIETPATGGLPACQAALHTCRTGLDTSSAELNTCNASLSTCSADLNTCEAQLATCQSGRHLLATGQTTCEDGSGTTIVCSGTGHDGDVRAGAAQSYTDNGDGTITDNNTGLMWEKKSDDTSIHVYLETYTWPDAFATFIATLNTPPCFAGHCDWRLPNVNELLSIVNYQNSFPSVASAFNNNCVSNCTVLTCSCTGPSAYWSSTSFLREAQPDSGFAYQVGFGTGGVSGFKKVSVAFFVRAVRGGL